MISPSPTSGSAPVAVSSAAGESLSRPLRAASALGLMTGAALLTALGAQVRIPLAGTDVPFTLQSVVVLLTGLLLAPRLALGAMSLYLALGLGHVIPFASQAGLFGRTGGYLVGFLLAAPLVSLLVQGRRERLGRQVWAAAVGTAVIFACGVGWRVAWFGDWRLAVLTGLTPFIIESSLKLALAVAAAQGSASIRRKWRAPGADCY